jgi:hypothetical protein
MNVVEKKPFQRYELGPTRCSRLKPGVCGVIAFLTKNKDARDRILKKLHNIPMATKSAELRNAQAFLEKIGKKLDKVPQEDPCLTVGDLLIALESAGIPFFYTSNSTESQYLCRPLNQTLIVRPLSPLKEDIVCDSSSAGWPVFGNQAGCSSPERDDTGSKS